METIARSLTASESSVTANMERKPKTVDGIVSKFVSKVPKLKRSNMINVRLGSKKSK